MSTTPSHYSLRSQHSLKRFPNISRFIQQLPPPAPKKSHSHRTALKSRQFENSSFSRPRSDSVNSCLSSSSADSCSSFSSSSSSSTSSPSSVQSFSYSSYPSFAKMGGKFWSRIKNYTGEDPTVVAADWVEEYELLANEFDCDSD